MRVWDAEVLTAGAVLPAQADTLDADDTGTHSKDQAHYDEL